LNVSRGGLRVILEEKVELGSEFDLVVQGESGLDVQRTGRVVWVQDEPDGAIVGFEFLGEPSSEGLPATSESRPTGNREPDEGAKE
jgi:hypothetical protein